MATFDREKFKRQLADLEPSVAAIPIFEILNLLQLELNQLGMTYALVWHESKVSSLDNDFAYNGYYQVQNILKFTKHITHDLRRFSDSFSINGESVLYFANKKQRKEYNTYTYTFSSRQIAVQVYNDLQMILLPRPQPVQSLSYFSL